MLFTRSKGTQKTGAAQEIKCVIQHFSTYLRGLGADRGGSRNGCLDCY